MQFLSVFCTLDLSKRTLSRAVDEGTFQPPRAFNVERIEFEYNFDSAKSDMVFLRRARIKGVRDHNVSQWS